MVYKQEPVNIVALTKKNYVEISAALQSLLIIQTNCWSQINQRINRGIFIQINNRVLLHK